MGATRPTARAARASMRIERFRIFREADGSKLALATRLDFASVCHENRPRGRFIAW